MNYHKLKFVLSSVVGLTLFYVPSSAWAENEDEDKSTHSELEVIVVTAQKRTQNLQETPIAVTAFTADDLQNKNINNIAQIAEFTPNLIFDETAPLVARLLRLFCLFAEWVNRAIRLRMIPALEPI
ncbi:MAG: hypothetical protein JKY14_02400 [Paraglaciecola sp.]|nr:hypothetical protein [Paraglaciecola sp.]